MAMSTHRRREIRSRCFITVFFFSFSILMFHLVTTENLNLPIPAIRIAGLIGLSQAVSQHPYAGSSALTGDSHAGIYRLADLRRYEGRVSVLVPLDVHSPEVASIVSRINAAAATSANDIPSSRVLYIGLPNGPLPASATDGGLQFPLLPSHPFATHPALQYVRTRLHRHVVDSFAPVVVDGQGRIRVLFSAGAMDEAAKFAHSLVPPQS
eukprot:TRINITY_DN44838_c0_g1_i1.p1 TRINITY_DN44838_c0_g1~~TRINITY_DN44838_c0_g1_i1.p1  ORF type:complete len:210 (+),score=16.67 TRINITY_DN44838_c0_g1_i1:65-694(+)